jgi:hypothetical protein
MTIANMRAIENTRITSQAAESRRRGRWQEKNAEFLQARQERQEVRQERQDRVPPCIETTSDMRSLHSQTDVCHAPHAKVELFLDVLQVILEDEVEFVVFVELTDLGRDFGSHRRRSCPGRILDNHRPTAVP